MYHRINIRSEEHMHNLLKMKQIRLATIGYNMS